MKEQVSKRSVNLRVTLTGCLCNKSIMNIIFYKIVHWMVSCSIIVETERVERVKAVIIQ